MRIACNDICNDENEKEFSRGSDEWVMYHLNDMQTAIIML
jgi:hypothetical protein